MNHHLHQSLPSPQQLAVTNQPAPAYCDMYYQVCQPIRVAPQQSQVVTRNQSACDAFTTAAPATTTTTITNNQNNGHITDGFGQFDYDDSAKQNVFNQCGQQQVSEVYNGYANRVYLQQTHHANGSRPTTVTYQIQNTQQQPESASQQAYDPQTQTIGYAPAQQIQYVHSANDAALPATSYTTIPNHQQQATTTTQHHHHHHPQVSHNHHHSHLNQQHPNQYQPQHQYSQQLPTSIANLTGHHHSATIQQNTNYVQYHTTAQPTLIASTSENEDQYNNVPVIVDQSQVFYTNTPVVNQGNMVMQRQQPATITINHVSDVSPTSIRLNNYNNSDSQVYGQHRQQSEPTNNLLTLPQQQRLQSQQQQPVTSVTPAIVAASPTKNTLTKESVIVTSGSRSNVNSPNLKNQYDCSKDIIRQPRSLSATPYNDASLVPRTQQQQQQQQQQDFLEMRSCGNLTQDRLDFICEKLIGDMDRFGICVIDNFLGSMKGELILKEVQQLYSSGQYTKGRLVSNKFNGSTVTTTTTTTKILSNGSSSSSTTTSPKTVSSSNSPSLMTFSNTGGTTASTSGTGVKTIPTSSATTTRTQLDATGAIRSDRVIWIDGCEEGCSEINNLIQTLCSVITNSSRLSLYSNNRLDRIVINKRTKAHVACYPGNGTRYIKHVDNPNGDGRVITAIYYLNKNWNTERDGGLLRMFPAGMDRVANIEPLFDRALFFWSDRRNPHEVLPAYRDRFAITVWYIGENRT